MEILKTSLTRLFHIISYKQKKLNSSAPLRLDDVEPVSLPVAGVMYENRWKLALKCALRESVWLRREPKNLSDKNAIAVVNRRGQKIGFIGKQIASQIAQYIDANPTQNQAVITELTSTVADSVTSTVAKLVIGVKVGFYLPRTLLSQISDSHRKLEFYYEESASGTVYLLLDCDEAVLHQVLEKLKEQGLQWLRFGISYREASNGRFYHWYIVLECRINQQELNQFFQDYFGVASEVDQESQSLDNWIENFSKENRELKDENTYLVAKLDELQQELDQTHEKTVKTEPELNMIPQKISRRQEVDKLTQVIQIFLPNIVFLRKSTDIITSELRDFQPVLKKLHTISINPDKLMADKIVQGTDGWWEWKFNTGQKKDGRLYLKRDADKCLALVSFKGGQGDQDRDIQYLQEN